MMFDSLVLGVMTYGIELIGWKQSAEMERIQLKYIEWSLGLNRCTPGYIVLAETNRKKIRIKAGRRAMKFKEGIRTSTDILILREYLREKERNIGRERDCKEIEEYLKRNDYSQQGVVKLRERREDIDIVSELTTRDKQAQEQEQFNKISNTKYNRIYKFI